MSQRVISALVISLFFVVTSEAEKPGRAAAIAFPQNSNAIVKLHGTYRLPGASGTVRVERHAPATTLRVRIDDLLPATLFGGDYNTYVLWAISGGGRTENLGDLRMDGDHAEMNVAVDASIDTFGIIVTAEPHFLVREPSRFVVLEFKGPAGKRHSETSTIPYVGFQGVYNFSRDSLEGLKEARGAVQSGVQQALTALRLAQRASAPEFAPREFDEAQRAFDSVVAITNDGTAGSQGTEAGAREAVRFAVAAESIARDRALAGIPGSGF